MISLLRAVHVDQGFTNRILEREDASLEYSLV
jgi:hypothetical protein